MAGKKGMTGGGGARPGAGRKPREPELVVLQKTEDPETFLTLAMNNTEIDFRLRLDAAKALMPFKHHKLGDSGKKGEQAKKAANVSRGKFAPSAPPKLVVNNR